MEFKYVAQTKKGRKKSGTITALNLSDAKRMLLEEDLILTSVEPIKVRKRKGFYFPVFGRVSFIDKFFFVKHLAMMIKTGLPLREGISEIREQTRSRKFRRVLDDIISHLDNGESLADSLASHSNTFDNLFVSLIRAGEVSGTLEENLNYLTVQLEKSNQLKKKIKTAMLYPALILGSTFILVGVLAVFVLPKLLPLFENFDVELPVSTRFLLWGIRGMQSYGLFVVFWILASVLIFLFISRIRTVKIINHTIILKFPITEGISRNVNLAFSARTLGTLIKSGIPLVEALEITADTLSNLVYQEHLKKSVSRIKQGEQIAVYFKSEPDLFPPVFSRMISVGEKTGKLDESLLYLAEFYEREVDDAARNLSTVLEPAMLVVIGFIIGFIAISIITPIYKITHGLSGLGR